MCKPSSKIVGLGYYIAVASLMGLLTFFHQPLDATMESILERQLDIHGFLLSLNIVLLIYIPLAIGFVYLINKLIVEDIRSGNLPPLMAMHPFDYWMLTHRCVKKSHKH